MGSLLALGYLIPAYSTIPQIFLKANAIGLQYLSRATLGGVELIFQIPTGGH